MAARKEVVRERSLFRFGVSEGPDRDRPRLVKAALLQGYHLNLSDKRALGMLLAGGRAAQRPQRLPASIPYVLTQCRGRSRSHAPAKDGTSGVRGRPGATGFRSAYRRGNPRTTKSIPRMIHPGKRVAIIHPILNNRPSIWCPD